MGTSSAPRAATGGTRPVSRKKTETPPPLARADFRRRLAAWYRKHARDLPWRNVNDPYATWLSEIMLQQTRVATVIDRYIEFLRRFPTIRHLAEAQEADVLALWSGLGYYRRARMLHRGAQFVVREMGGRLPHDAGELRTLPGIGDYTAAAIASIAFGRNVAVLDGNVERVLLRILGEAENKSSQARARLLGVAQSLMPPLRAADAANLRNVSAGSPQSEAAGTQTAARNLSGDHNQAMMELGATICLPRQPLCLQCPVVTLCATRGEHVTSERSRMQSRTVAHLLTLRKKGTLTEVLLERRAPDASLMPGMLELPPLPLDAVEGREPALRLRHAITNTNFYVWVYTESAADAVAGPRRSKGAAARLPARSLQRQIPTATADLQWVETTRLAQVPLTGLARKVLQRLAVMTLPPLRNT
jgi:A/G-specific adenine glycosylase